jgi:H+/Cl- antiporter ClcA
MPSKLYCSKCGKEVSQDARYCPHCGAVLKTNKLILQEKIAESRHNELSSAIGAIISVLAILFGGYLMTITETRYDFFYVTIYRPYYNLGLGLIITGIIGLILSAIAGTYFYYQRMKLMKELESAGKD